MHLLSFNITIVLLLPLSLKCQVQGKGVAGGYTYIPETTKFTYVNQSYLLTFFEGRQCAEFLQTREKMLSKTGDVADQLCQNEWLTILQHAHNHFLLHHPHPHHVFHHFYLKEIYTRVAFFNHV